MHFAVYWSNNIYLYVIKWFTMGTPYIFYIYRIKFGWLGRTQSTVEEIYGWVKFPHHIDEDTEYGGRHLWMCKIAQSY